MGFAGSPVFSLSSFSLSLAQENLASSHQKLGKVLLSQKGRGQQEEPGQPRALFRQCRELLGLFPTWWEENPPLRDTELGRAPGDKWEVKRINPKSPDSASVS